MTDHPDHPDQPPLADMSDIAGQSDMSDTPGVPGTPALSVAEAAALLGVNERTVRRYIEKGKLAADRVLSDRHTVELRISRPALADYLGRRTAVEHEETGSGAPSGGVDTPPGTQAGMPASLSARPADLSVLLVAISDRLEDQYQARLADKDELIGELRRRAEAAEREAEELRRARRRLPWWLRLLLGGR